MNRPWVLLTIGLILVLCLLPPGAYSSSSGGQNDQLVRVGAPTAHPTTRVYIQPSGVDERSVIELRKRLIAEGVERVNLFVPAMIIVCDVPKSVDLAALVGDSRYLILTEAQVDLRASAGGGAVGLDDLGFARMCYEPRLGALFGSAPIDGGGSFDDVVRMVRPEDVEESSRRARLSAVSGAAQVRNIQQNAEFLVGDVLIQLVFPESDGHDEDWTDERLANASSGAFAAATAFQSMFGYAPMHFVMKIEKRIATTYEPIQTTMGDHPLWIYQTMAALGVDTGDPPDLMVHDYNNAGRYYYGTDWVFTAFIANGENDLDHRFADGYYTAYAYLGGPYLVIPHPAGENPFGIDPWLVFSTIFQHEMSHVFWALDEYPGPNNMSSCKSRSGYLNYFNMNKVEELEPGVFFGCPPWELQLCIMWRAKEDHGRPVCRYTQGQLGLIDSNWNSIPDVFDAAPTAEYLPAATETIQTPDVTIRIKAVSRAVENLNPFQVVEDRVSYAPPLKGATLNVNGIGGIHLNPLDGNWDENEEDLSMSVTGIPVGVTEFGIVVRNAFGKSSVEMVKQIFFPGIKFVLFDVDPLSEGIRVSWSTVGETFGARLDLHRVDTTGGEPDTTLIAAGMDPVTPPVGSFRQYTFVDTDVVPGVSYRYFVKGYFQIVYPDRTVEYQTASDTHEAQSMFPIPSGTIASFVSPNPFSAKTHISVRVPAATAVSGASSSSSARSIQTQINVTVYDVAGRPVKKIFDGRVFSGVRTFDWNGTNEGDEKVPSGVYFVKTIAGPATEVRKVVVVR